MPSLPGDRRAPSGSSAAPAGDPAAGAAPARPVDPGGAEPVDPGGAEPVDPGGTEAADPGVAEGVDAGHFLAHLGLRQWADGADTHGRAAIRPDLCVPGTGIPRIGVLATFVDVVVGSRPEGPINPTVDLQVRMLAFPQMAEVRVDCQVLRAGRTLLVGETFLYADDARQPFAHGIATFLNRPMDMARLAGHRSRPAPPPSVAAALPPLGELLGLREIDDVTLEIDLLPRLVNGSGGTIQGGVQALLAELAAERVVARSEQVVAGSEQAVVTDLDIRYLDRVRTGPLRARAAVLAADGAGASVQVRLTDAGAADRLVAMVSTACLLRPRERGSQGSSAR